MRTGLNVKNNSQSILNFISHVYIPYRIEERRFIITVTCNFETNKIWFTLFQTKGPKGTVLANYDMCDQSAPKPGYASTKVPDQKKTEKSEIIFLVLHKNMVAAL